MISLIKNFALISIIVGFLVGMGLAVNALFPWSWVTIFFALVRQLVMPFDFFWDTDTLFALVTISLSLEATFWTIRSFMGIIHMSGINQN